MVLSLRTLRKLVGEFLLTFCRKIAGESNKSLVVPNFVQQTCHPPYGGVVFPSTSHVSPLGLSMHASRGNRALQMDVFLLMQATTYSLSLQSNYHCTHQRSLPSASVQAAMVQTMVNQKSCVITTWQQLDNV